MITFAELTFEIDKHDVRTTWLELNGLAGLNFDVTKFTHFCDTIFHCHRVKLKPIRNVN